MADHSVIEWTEATWNPTSGCTKVSPGCDRCYAERVALRFPNTFPSGFDFTLRAGALELPMHWRRPRTLRYLREHPINYAIVVADRTFGQEYKVTSMPVTLLIDRKGRVADWHIGVVDRTIWEAEIKALLLER